MRLPSSLAGRLISAATLWSAATLLIAGLILTSLYRQTVVSAFDERLSVYLRTLVGVFAAETPQGDVHGRDGQADQAPAAPVMEVPPHAFPEGLDAIGLGAQDHGPQVPIDEGVHGGAVRAQS